MPRIVQVTETNSASAGGCNGCTDHTGTGFRKSPYWHKINDELDNTTGLRRFRRPTARAFVSLVTHNFRRWCARG